MEQLIVSPHLNPLPQGERADASASTLAANLTGGHLSYEFTDPGKNQILTPGKEQHGQHRYHQGIRGHGQPYPLP